MSLIFSPSVIPRTRTSTLLLGLTIFLQDIKEIHGKVHFERN